MRLARDQRRRLAFSLVPLIDVLMILLIFFMVTSSYLDLDMVRLAEGSGHEAGASAGAAGGARLLVRLGADGRAYVGGRPETADRLRAILAERVTREPGLEVLVLPSGQASVQALASLMDAAAGSGVERLRVVRLEARR